MKANAKQVDYLPVENLWTTLNIVIAWRVECRAATINATQRKKKERWGGEKKGGTGRAIGSTWRPVDRLETGRDFYGSCFPRGHKSFIWIVYRDHGRERISHLR